MKRSVKIIIGIELVVLLAVIIAAVVVVNAQKHYAHRSMRNAMNTIQMDRPGMARGMNRDANLQRIKGMRPVMRSGHRYGTRGGMGPGQMRPGSLFGNIPNLSEKQKKDIADLRQKQQDEMKKLRDEMSAKIKILKDSHKNKVLDLLTPEQKKILDSNSGNTNN